MTPKTFEKQRAQLANPKLLDAIARLSAAPTPDHRSLLHQSLLSGPLLIALRELPKDLGGDPQAIERELPVEFVTHVGPEGNRVLAGFTDPQAVAARAPAAVCFATEPLAVLRWIAEEGLEGILLNPQGPSAFVSHDEVLELLGMGDRKRRQGRSLSVSQELENAIHQALGRLLTEAGGDAGVAIEEPRTRRLIRFAKTDDGALLLVVPCASLSRDELERAKLMFEELAGLADEDQQSSAAAWETPPSEFQALFAGDPGRAAKAAVKIFTWVFGFPAGFDLEIQGPSPGPGTAAPPE